jgi:hypothetical protein
VKKQVVVVGLALQTAACVAPPLPPPPGALAMTCADFVGSPVAKGVAAFGPPRTFVRFSPTDEGYRFVTKTTALSGGEVYYTTNYLVGAERHHRPVYATTTTCQGTFAVSAPSGLVPPDRRILVDPGP